MVLHPFATPGDQFRRASIAPEASTLESVLTAIAPGQGDSRTRGQPTASHVVIVSRAIPIAVGNKLLRLGGKKRQFAVSHRNRFATAITWGFTAPFGRSADSR